VTNVGLKINRIQIFYRKSALGLFLLPENAVDSMRYKIQFLNSGKIVISSVAVSENMTSKMTL